MARTRKTYPAEYRRRLIELVRAGRSPEELAKEFEPSPNTIRKWATQADIDEGLQAEGLQGHLARVAAAGTQGLGHVVPAIEATEQQQVPAATGAASGSSSSRRVPDRPA